MLSVYGIQNVNGIFLLPRCELAQLSAQFVICHMGCGRNGIPDKHNHSLS